MSALYATVIYGLVDPRNHELRYVGKTIQPLEDRLRIHLNDAKNIKRRHVCVWIRKVARDGFTPEIFEIESVNEDWVQAEQFWIAYFRYVGAVLTNHTKGGEGALGYKHRPESRKKMSDILKVKMADPDIRRKISEAAKRQHADPESQARTTQGIRAAFRRPEVIANSNAARVRPEVMARRVASIKATFESDPEKMKRRGAAISAGKLKPEARAQAAESQRRRHIEKPFTAETRAKISRAFKGRVFSDETRKKMSDAAKNRRRREREAACSGGS